MRDEVLRHGGVQFLRLETVAEVYRVEVTWLEEVVELGLVGDVLVRERTVWIAGTELERVATLLRLRVLCGPDPVAIALALRQ